MFSVKIEEHRWALHGPMSKLLRSLSTATAATLAIVLLFGSSASVYCQTATVTSEVVSEDTGSSDPVTVIANEVFGPSGAATFSVTTGESKATPVVVAVPLGAEIFSVTTGELKRELPQLWAKATKPEPVVMAQTERISAPTISTTVVAAPVPAPEPKIFRVTISKQPLSTFVAVLGSKISGVAAYSSTTCSRLHETVTFSDDLIKQFVEEHNVPVVDYLGAKATAQAARRNSKQHKMFAITSEIATDASLVIAANFIHANPATTAGKLLRLAPIIIGTKAEQAKDALTAELPPVDVIFSGRILNGSDVTIQPGKCATRLFLGVHEKTISIRTIAGDLVL